MPTSLLTRPDENVFASAANAGEVKPFPNIPRGWGLTFDPAPNGNGGFPPVEWFNQLLQRIDSATQYFMQRGVTEWASTTLYAPGSVVSNGALVFRALQSNNGVTPGSDITVWSQLADASIAAVAAPPGLVGLFPASTIPAGWLKMNGASLSRVTYAALFAVIGTAYGAPDANTFNVPDVRGEFLRMWDDGRGVDKSRTIGSWQGADMQPHQHGGTAIAVGDHTHGASGWTDQQGSHAHYVNENPHVHGWSDGSGQVYAYAGGGSGLSSGNTVNRGTTMLGAKTGITLNADGLHAHNVGVSIGSAGGHAHTIQTDVQGGIETRPRNFCVMACIKY